MISTLPPLLALLTVVSYFALVARFGFSQAVPWPHLLLTAIACLWAAALVRKKRRLLPIASLVLTFALGGLFTWYLFGYSEYEQRPQQVADGQRLDALTTLRLENHQGDSTAVLASAPARATLMVFYRGFW